MLIICDLLWADGFSHIVNLLVYHKSAPKTHVLSYGFIQTDIHTNSH